MTEQENNNWITQAKEEGLPVSGNYLTIVEGAKYLLRFTDMLNENQDTHTIENGMNKDAEGNPKKVDRYTYHVELKGIQESMELAPVIQTDLETYPKKKVKFDALKENLNKEYILKLSKTARYKLAEFIENEKLQNEELFIYQRIGNRGFIFKRIGGDK